MPAEPGRPGNGAATDASAADESAAGGSTADVAAVDEAAGGGAAADEVAAGGAFAHVAATRVTATDGAATDGAATDDAATDGAATDGAATDGAAIDGTAADGPATGAGERVLDRATAAAAAEFGERLVAAYALGSLAHGGFCPLVSDVDLMLVLDPVPPDARDRVSGIAQRVRRAGDPELAARLSVFWSDPAGVRSGAGPHDRLPEVDRLDLLDSGRLLRGTDRRAGAEPPASAVLVRQAAEFALAKFDRGYLAGLRRPAELVAAGARPVTKAVLFPVRFLYTLDTGRIGRNEAAAAWYPGRHPHAELVTAALAWRTSGITDPPAARDLLARHLLGIYAIFAREYAAALAELGHPDLARALTDWATHLPR